MEYVDIFSTFRPLNQGKMVDFMEYIEFFMTFRLFNLLIGGSNCRFHGIYFRAERGLTSRSSRLGPISIRSVLENFCTIRPSYHPTIRPSNHPTIQPSDHPTNCTRFSFVFPPNFCQIFQFPIYSS